MSSLNQTNQCLYIGAAIKNKQVKAGPAGMGIHSPNQDIFQPHALQLTPLQSSPMQASKNRKHQWRFHHPAPFTTYIDLIPFQDTRPRFQVTLSNLWFAWRCKRTGSKQTSEEKAQKMRSTLALFSRCIDGAGVLQSLSSEHFRSKGASIFVLCSWAAFGVFVLQPERMHYWLVSHRAHGWTGIVRQPCGALIKQRALRCRQEDVGGSY